MSWTSIARGSIAAGCTIVASMSGLHAQSLTLVCGEGDGLFGGQPWTYYVDLDNQRVSRQTPSGMVTFSTEVTDHFITWADFAPVSYRIDRYASMITQSGGPWGTISRQCRLAKDRKF